MKELQRNPGGMLQSPSPPFGRGRVGGYHWGGGRAQSAQCTTICIYISIYIYIYTHAIVSCIFSVLGSSSLMMRYLDPLLTVDVTQT